MSWNSIRGATTLECLGLQRTQLLLQNLWFVLCLTYYVDKPILPSEIDRCHHIFEPVAGDTGPKPKDIIVKFVSHKTKAAVMTKQPKVKLRNDNKQKSSNARIYVSEDLTRVRSRILCRTRKLKRQQQIKDTYTLDGRIIIKTLSDRFLYISEKELQHV